MTKALGPNRSEYQALRGKRGRDAIEGWIAAFGGGDGRRAEKYAHALVTFLGQPRAGAPQEAGGAYMGSLSPNTQRAYTFALTEFFEWLATVRGSVVMPEEVTRKDAEEYANWLVTKPFSLVEEKLKDGDQKERLAIFEALQQLGSAGIDAIAEALPAWVRRDHPSGRTEAAERAGKVSRYWLSHELGRMVLHDVLTRTPTLDELRREDPRIGLTVGSVQVPTKTGWRTVLLEDIFIYSIPRPVPVGRLTVTARLAALSSFWDVLRQGDNIPGGEPLIRHNVFTEVKKRVSKGIAAERRRSSQRSKRLTPGIVRKLLEASDGPSLVEKRDAAILWFLVLTGTRVSEAIELRREPPDNADRGRFPGWFDPYHDPPIVTVFRKGGVRQDLPYPPYALRALYSFQEALRERAPRPEMQSTDRNAPHYLEPTSVAWRYKLLTESRDAPLFPPVDLWGANASGQYEEFKPNASLRHTRGISRHGVSALLKRLADKAGLSADEKKAVHPHALRHFAANAMDEQGKPIREIQAILGHASITTTETYVKPKEGIVALSGQSEILEHLARAPVEAPGEPEKAAAAVEPDEGPRPSVPRVVRTWGVPVDEAEPAAPPRAEEPREPSARPLLPQHLVATPPPAEHGIVVHQFREGVLPKGAALVEISGPEDETPEIAEELHDGVSPGSPTWVYDALASDGEAGDNIEFWTAKQSTPFLKTNYSAWPKSYGIGDVSLLPWFAKGQAVLKKAGKVAVTAYVTTNITDPITGEQSTVTVFPIPVLSPAQIYPEVSEPKTLLEAATKLYHRWIEEGTPERTYGLTRWLALFAVQTATLERAVGAKYKWITFENGVDGKVGRAVRTHQDAWLVRWLEHNALTYTTTVTAFTSIKRPKGGRLRTDEEWEEFKELFAKASYEGFHPQGEIPAWFAEADPVHTIYKRSASEYAQFEKWISSVTGQRITRQRQTNRSRQQKLAEDKMTAQIQQAEDILTLYYELKATENRKTKEGGILSSGQRIELREYVKYLDTLGVGDPELLKKQHKDMPDKYEDRIRFIIGITFGKERPELAPPNVFARSKLFDPDSFRIDPSAHTISHTAAYKATFAEHYDGRDSECLMRRAARSMWEYVKRAGDTRVKDPYGMMYAIMLANISWIVPCPTDMEKTIIKASLEGRITGDLAVAEYLRRFNARIRMSELGITPPDELQEEMEDDAAIQELLEQADPVRLHLMAQAAEHYGMAEDQALRDYARGGAAAGMRTFLLSGERLREEKESGAARTKRRLLVVTEEEADDASVPAVEVIGTERDELQPNDARPRVFFSNRALQRAHALIDEGRTVLPTPLHMIAAMTLTP